MTDAVLARGLRPRTPSPSGSLALARPGGLSMVPEPHTAHR
jgi:hypothetical protein